MMAFGPPSLFERGSGRTCLATRICGSSEFDTAVAAGAEVSTPDWAVEEGRVLQMRPGTSISAIVKAWEERTFFPGGA